MKTRNPRFVLSLDGTQRHLVQALQKKLYQDSGGIALPPMVRVVQKALADMAATLGVDTPVPEEKGRNGRRGRGKHRKARQAHAKGPRKPAEVAEVAQEPVADVV